jgi:uncharacterized protein with PIN domain
MRAERHALGLLVLLLSTFTVACSHGSPGDAVAELALLEQRDAQYPGWKIAGRLSLVPDYERFTRKYWGTEEALVAQLWLLEQSANQFEAAQYKPTAFLGGKRRARLKVKRVDHLMKGVIRDYIDSPRLADIAKLVGVFTDEQRQHYLNTLIEDSPHREVQAACLFKLAAVAQRRETEEEAQRAQELLRRLIAEYSDVPWEDRTYGELAAARLGPPQIGNPAMEIVGVTWDGTPMRLSDFIGKVVVLDFWGDW